MFLLIESHTRPAYLAHVRKWCFEAIDLIIGCTVVLLRLNMSKLVCVSRYMS